MWRGGLGTAYLFSAPFVWRCLSIRSVPRFHIPLIEPDMRISRIRLSDKASCVRPREAARQYGQANEAVGLVELPVGVACGAPPCLLVLPTQPSAPP